MDNAIFTHPFQGWFAPGLGIADTVGRLTGTPLRAPNYTAIPRGLAGEAELARGGVILLFDFPEFSRGSIEALGCALRAIPEGERPLVVATRAVCPCNATGDMGGGCLCSPTDKERYEHRIDRLLTELRVPVTRMDKGESHVGH